jgi:GDP-L-fucose synthase
MVGRNIFETVPATFKNLYLPKSSEVNLLDIIESKKFVSDLKPDLIIHVAGRVGGIAANMAAPYEFLFENLEMGKNLVAAALEAKVPRFLNFSSSCVYPRFGQNPLKEESILTGELEPTNEGYALGKLVTMRLGEFASKKGNLSFKSLIPCNLFGRHDHFHPQKSHLLPSIVMKVHEAKIEKKKTIEIWGSGTARREFMLASDLARITWRCVERFDELPVQMNVGLGFDYSVKEYYEIAAKVLGWDGTFTHDMTRPEGMKQKLVDISRLSKLGLKATTSLEDGIRETYDFYLSQLETP